MEAILGAIYKNNGFDYDNYSNGRWGFHVGTQFGKQFDKFSVAAFAEVLRTFGNDNNSIDVTGYNVTLAPGLAMPMTKLGFENEISVDGNEIYESLRKDKKDIKLDGKQFNITQEENSQYIPFEMPRYYDGFDLKGTKLSIYYVNKKIQTNAIIFRSESCYG